MSLSGLFTYYWKLDEASGVAASSAGSADLTATNSPVAGTGKIGNGRAFVAASSQQLSRNMILGVSYNTDWSLCFWVKIAGSNWYDGLFRKNIPGQSFRVFLSGADGLSTDGFGGGYTSAGGFFTAGQWCQVTFTYNGTGDKKVRVYKNGSLVNTNTAYGGTSVDDDAAQTMWIGSLGGGNYLGGILDEIGFAASTCFSDSQVQEYYDAINAGLSYPFGGLLRHPGMGGGMAELLGGMRA